MLASGSGASAKLLTVPGGFFFPANGGGFAFINDTKYIMSSRIYAYITTWYVVCQ